jgi:hypothetical protein
MADLERAVIEQILDDHAEISINEWDAKYGTDCSLAQAIRNALDKAPAICKQGRGSCEGIGKCHHGCVP